MFGNGSGGDSIWGKKFKDDPGGLKLKHDRMGVVSMGNSGKHSNTRCRPLSESHASHSLNMVVSSPTLVS